MADLPRFDQRMSEPEGLMWRMDKDPYLSSTFANVSILDRAPDVERLRRRLAHAALVVPRLRQRVLAAPANLGPPLWVEDPDLDLQHHVRHLAVPKGATLRDGLDLAALLAADPFERTRPLWQFTVIEGLPRGRAILLVKLHHTVADGEGSIRVSMQFLDLQRDAADPPPPDPELLVVGPAAAEPNAADVVRDLVAGSLRLPIGMLRQLRDLAGDPGQLPGAGMAAMETVRGVMQQLSEADGARSPLWTARSLRRRFEVLRVPLDPTKAAAKRLGGSVNTALLAASAHAAGAYHREFGAPVEELRASMAVSTRTESSGANAFSLARFLVPTGEMSLADRFVAIDALARTARESSATANLDALAALASSLPTSLVTRLARQQAQTVDFATSNVRAAPIPLFVAGARVLENYPIGPLLGVAFNLTLLSYNGSLDMGIHVDAAAIAAPDRLRELIEAAFGELSRQ